jgi:hypothetical protein
MDEIRVWRLHYKARLTIPEHVAMMKSRPQPDGYKITMCFGDAADPEAAAQVSQILAPCAAMPEAKENWREGIELVKQFMRIEDEIEIDEDFVIHVTPKTHFYVDHSCVDFIREVNNYKTKEPVKGNNVPEMGQKQDDHAMDAIRYGLMHLYKVGASYHLDDVYTPAQLESNPESPLWTPDSRLDAGFFTFSSTDFGQF